MLSRIVLFGLLLTLAVEASPTHIKRGRHKRSVCATKNTTSTSVIAETSGSAVPVNALAVVADVQGPDGHVGHWKAVTTSVFVYDETPSSTAAIPTSTVAPASSDPNPITSFLTTTSADVDAALSLSISLGIPGLTLNPPSNPIPPSTSTTLPPPSSSPYTPPPNTKPNPAKHVFAHFMVGIVSTYTLPDWIADMTLAQSKGITGFALNIGVDPYSQAQLDLAYAAANTLSFDVFISFDFNWYTLSETQGVADMLKRYVGNKSQLRVEGKPFVSTFIGDGFDWAGVAGMVGEELYAVPYWGATAGNAGNAGLKGLFSWDAWPGQLTNTPVAENMTSTQDELYLGLAKAAGKQYMAPVSPWFSTHFGKEVSYSKNWVFYSETLWKTRWDQILQMGADLNFLEIVTWNDYGESHYIGPYDTPHTDDGSSKWAKGLDHTPMLDFAIPYINAFKTGSTQPVIEQEMLVYWHRPHLKAAECDSTDNCGKKPTGYEMLEDSVFVATMTKSGGVVTITSGGNSPYTQNVDAGVQVFQVPMGVGSQSFSIKSNTGGSGSGTSSVPISSSCWNGIYNYNFHSGSIKV